MRSRFCRIMLCSQLLILTTLGRMCMEKRLTWEEIKNSYCDEWVELIDYEWNEFEPKPRSGVVRNHAKSRKELHDRFMKAPIEDSAMVYTGAIKFTEGTVFSANLHQYMSSK